MAVYFHFTLTSQIIFFSNVSRVYKVVLSQICGFVGNMKIDILCIFLPFKIM